VRSGQFASAEDVLSAMIEALEEQEEYEAEVRRKVKEGRESLDRGDAFSREEAATMFQLDRARARGDQEAVRREMDAMTQRCGVPLSVWHRAFIDEEVQAGRYASPREMMETALVVLREADAADDDEGIAELRREIDLGFESGDREELIPGDEVKARIRAKLRGGAP
ncbi:MAG TPA: type II toxin-antitoxin system ParD family antitoxin, partial [Longimicrobium sp.]|nr:type II toxin-antitoxin system ParD family antitoxin [Longimicrobium sp.]